MEDNNRRQCKAHNRRGERCKRPAVIGRTVCYMHGGHAGRPIVTGLHSKELPALTEKQRADIKLAEQDLLDMKPIIATMKVRLDNTETLETVELFGLLETMSRVIERHEKLSILSKQGVPKDQVKIFINRLIYILTNADLTPEQLSKLGTEINKAATETMPI